MNTRKLTSDELNAAMEGYPRPMKSEPVIRIRHVFIALFMTGLISGLMIADPLTMLIEMNEEVSK